MALFFNFKSLFILYTKFSTLYNQPQCDYQSIYLIIYPASLKETCVYTKSLELYPTLFNPMDSSPPGSSVHGILRARILGCVVIPFSRRSFLPRDWTQVSSLVGRFFTTSTIWEALRSLQARTKYRSSKRPTETWAILYKMKCTVITSENHFTKHTHQKKKKNPLKCSWQKLVIIFNFDKLNIILFFLFLKLSSTGLDPGPWPIQCRRVCDENSTGHLENCKTWGEWLHSRRQMWLPNGMRNTF